MMKKVFLAAAASALLLPVSCDKNAQEGTAAPGKPVEVTVRITGDGSTRATGTTYADESKVQDLQVFVFDENGEIQDYKSAGEAMTASLTTTSGEKTVWALVNGPSLPSIATEAELATQMTLLGANGTDRFIMAGSKTQELVDGGTVPVVVKRIVSRVSVGKITSAFRSPVLAAKELRIDAIYLINVAAESNLEVTSEPALWLNKLGHADTEADPLLYDAVDAVVTAETPYETEHAFYPYPNPVETETYDDVWSPRHTMLTVEVTFDGQKGYYPVELPVLERNKTYSIEEIIITRAPGDKPYQPVETGEATAQITVSEWELGLNLGTITI